MARFRWDFKEVDKGLGDLLKVVKSLAQGDAYVKAGVLASSESREGGGAGNVEIATYQEFGTASIPARSFIRAPVDANRDTYIKSLRKLVREVYEAKRDIRSALAIVGMQMARDMKSAINRSSGGNAPFPPNAPSTITKKGSSRPLIDTGQLRNAITSAVVVPGGGGHE